MLTTLQIVLLSLTGASALATITLFIMFIVEITVEKKEKQPKAEVKSIYSESNYASNINDTQEVSVDDMLAKLDEQTEEVSIVDEIVVEEAKPEEIIEEKIEEVKSEKIVEDIKIEEVADIEEDDSQEETSEEDVEILNDIEDLKAQKHEPIVAGSAIDYKSRLDKIVENRDKIEKDLAKIQKSILKYERTKRRKTRNQKMLDRRASELTNLNLVMYSVTDIKNVDEDKKVKQEELTAHIAELKASIQDAEEYIESNKEKNEHNVKMAKFLIQEKTRYNEEIAEIEALIANADDSVSA